MGNETNLIPLPESNSTPTGQRVVHPRIDSKNRPCYNAIYDFVPLATTTGRWELPKCFDGFLAVLQHKSPKRNLIYFFKCVSFGLSCWAEADTLSLLPTISIPPIHRVPLSWPNASRHPSVVQPLAVIPNFLIVTAIYQ